MTTPKYWNDRNSDDYPVPTTEEPDFETLENWCLFDGCAEATDGCTVEPDGVCEHGHVSWPIYLGYM